MPRLNRGISLSQKRKLLEVISRANCDQGRGQAVLWEAEPSLIFIVGARIEVWQNPIVKPCTDGQHIVCKIGMPVAGKCWKVEDAATIQDLAVRYEPSVAPVVPAADLVGLFVDIRSAAILDEMKYPFHAKVMHEVEVEVGRSAVDLVRKIIGICGSKSASDLEISGPRSGGSGLGKHHRCGTYQADENENFFEQSDLPEMLNCRQFNEKGLTKRIRDSDGHDERRKAIILESRPILIFEIERANVQLLCCS